MAYDVVIVGGGITGAGVARDCAMRGLKTLMLERGKPGMATTVSSTHLIHGGLRYLLYDRLTTHTTCWDSGHIIRIAAPLLTRLPILWPVYADHTHGIETVETLIEVYDRFSKMKGGLPHLRLSAEETLKLVPSLKREGLVGAVSFDEWWVDPVGLVEANLESARRHGAEVRTGARVEGFIKGKDSAISGVRVAEADIEARLVINAAGPWVDKVARMAGTDIALRLQKGTHLGYKERLVPVGLLLEAAGGGRYVFVVPSPQGTLVGPTDLAAGTDPDAVATAPDEVSYLLASVRRYLPAFPERYDFLTVGARPILGQAGNEKLLSREFEVFDHLKRDGIDGLLTIGGGKMSDFRVMGQAVVDAACARLGVDKACATHLETLSGEALAPVKEPPQPSRSMKRFLRRHPRLREAHAMAYLGGAFLRHLGRRAFQAGPSPAAELKRHYGLAALLLLALVPARAARASALKDGWQLQSACQAPQSGEEISSPRFSPQGWHQASVPSTVLAALVADKTYPDPYVGMNLRSIPGTDYPLGDNFSNLPMSSTSPFHCSWWYRKEFALPRLARGRRAWLRLDGINYRADLWLNGRKIADSSGLAGTWRRYELDVTSAVVSGRNALAVEVSAPGENDLAITWVDWNPAPPDKDMGLFGPVNLEETGPVAVQRPAVFSELSDDLSTARLTVEARLVNRSDKAVTGELSASFDKRAVSKEVELAPGEARVVRLTPDRFPQLALRKPKLWWPYQMGTPNLYSMRLAFKSGASVSDSKTVSFGIRRVETEEAPESKAALFRINGRRVLIRGGGWASDMLLRQSKKRLEDELAYVQQLNLNTVRLEGKLETDDFFAEADRRGILVMAGWSCCDAWELWKDWKDEQHAVAAASLEDQIARLRGHPSLLVWLNGSDIAPPKDVEQTDLDVLKKLSWPDPVLPSASDQGGIAGRSGVKMEGPYDYVPPGYWLSDEKRGGAFGFATEVSPGPAIPALESLKRMLGADHLWPADAFWSYHAGGSVFAQTQAFDTALEKRYGKPTDLADYERKAQAAAYEGERAMFEAFARNKYRATGVIQWMLNNAWPSTIWHLYDYYLVPGGGFFGTRAACEPVHAQYSYDDRSVVVVSDLAKPVRDVRVEAKIVDLSAKERYAYAKDLDLEPDASTRAFVLPHLAGLTTTYFLRLSLIDTNGKLLSENLYWLSTTPDTLDWDKAQWYRTPQSSFADYSGLQSLPPATLKVSSSLRLKNGRPEAKIVLRNVGRSVAFMARLRLTRRSDGREIAPTFWSDDYVSLLPGESETVTASYDRQDADGGTPALSVDGWNLAPSSYALAR